MPVTGWKLDRAERAALLGRFAPQWPDILADHVTLDADADGDDPLPPETQAEIVGGIDDGEGLQAMVVAIAGGTERPDGGTYHITWSLDRTRGRRAVQSNDVIRERGWRPLDDPVPIRIHPARWDSMRSVRAEQPGGEDRWRPKDLVGDQDMPEQRKSDADRRDDGDKRDTPGGQPQQDVEDRPSVGDVKSEDYPNPGLAAPD